MSKEELLSKYRKHVPQISMNNATIEVLNGLKDSGVKIALITDGRSLTQRNKIRALGLDQYAEPENVIISEECGAEKTSPKPFEIINKKFPIFY